MSNIQSEYKNLYRKILEIGKTRINTGISYTDLTNTLKAEGLSIDGCSTLAIKKFFCDNFYHATAHNKPAPTPENLTTEHPTCNFVMTGDACLALEKFTEVEELKKASKLNFWLAIAAIIIGAIGNIPTWFPSVQISSNKNSETPLQSNSTKDEQSEVILRLNYSQFQNLLQQQTPEQTKKDVLKNPNIFPSNQLKQDDKKNETK
jgi:hypothetical protein